jgi:hypothetical protein
VHAAANVLGPENNQRGLPPPSCCRTMHPWHTGSGSALTMKGFPQLSPAVREMAPSLHWHWLKLAAPRVSLSGPRKSGEPSQALDSHGRGKKLITRVAPGWPRLVARVQIPVSSCQSNDCRWRSDVYIGYAHSHGSVGALNQIALIKPLEGTSLAPAAPIVVRH